MALCVVALFLNFKILLTELSKRMRTKANYINIVLCGCEAFGRCVRAAYGLQERWRGKLRAGTCGTP